MRTTFYFLAALMLSLFSACHKEEVTERTDGVWVQFHNKTDEDVENIVIRFYNNDSLQVGTIKTGESSAFLKVKSFPLWNYSSGTGKGYLNGTLTSTMSGKEVYFGTTRAPSTGAVLSELPDGKYVISLNKAFEVWYFNYWLEFE